jgi:hypothetical protein
MDQRFNGRVADINKSGSSFFAQRWLVQRRIRPVQRRIHLTGIPQQSDQIFNGGSGGTAMLAKPIGCSGFLLGLAKLEQLNVVVDRIAFTRTVCCNGAPLRETAQDQQSHAES